MSIFAFLATCRCCFFTTRFFFFVVFYSAHWRIRYCCCCCRVQILVDCWENKMGSRTSTSSSSNCKCISSCTVTGRTGSSSYTPTTTSFSSSSSAFSSYTCLPRSLWYSTRTRKTKSVRLPIYYRREAGNDFCRAMLCISAVYAVMRCLSVCPSVCHVRGSC